MIWWIVGSMLLFWWLGTGLVFAAANGPPRRRGWAFGVGSVLTLSVLPVLPALPPGEGLAGMVAGMVGGFALWAWMDLSFYTGFVTGPVTAPPPEGAGFLRRLLQAIGACLWHELAILGAMGAILWLSPAGNAWAAVTFGSFWLLHEVARLNVLAGVPHPFAELLPEHLAHLQPYLRPGPGGIRLPLTLGGLGALTALAVHASVTGATPAQVSGWAAIAALMALGLLELVVLLLPIPLERLWNWVGMTRDRELDPAASSLVSGPAPAAAAASNSGD